MEYGPLPTSDGFTLQSFAANTARTLGLAEDLGALAMDSPKTRIAIFL